MERSKFFETKNANDRNFSKQKYERSKFSEIISINFDRSYFCFEKFRSFAQKKYSYHNDTYDASICISVDYIKIVQPVETRWNSVTMCINSIVKIRQPLVALKEEGNPDLVDKIPSKKQFDSFEELLKPMMFIKEVSDKLQTDKKPMLHMVIFFLMSLCNMSRSKQFQSTSTTTKTFVQAFEENLSKRIKNWGRGVSQYCLGNFLHPSFRGSLLKKSGGEDSYDRTIEYIKKLYEEPEQQPQDSQDLFATGPGPSQPSSQGAEWMAFDLEDILASEGPATTSNQDKSKIEIELEKWLEYTPVERDVELDILEYWKVKSKDLPLLGKLARNSLGIQVTSSSSERLFSEGGQVATNRRPLLASNQCEKLVFIHENYEALGPLMKKWKTDIKDFIYEEKDKDKDTEKEASEASDEPSGARPGTSAEALRDRDEEPSFRVARTSGGSDPDDPAAMPENLIEGVDTPISPDDEPDAPIEDFPFPTGSDDDEGVEEVPDEDD